MRTRWLYVGPKDAWERRGSPGTWVGDGRGYEGSLGEDVQIIVLGRGPWPEAEELRARLRDRGCLASVSRG